MKPTDHPAILKAKQSTTGETPETVQATPENADQFNVRINDGGEVFYASDPNFSNHPPVPAPEPEPDGPPNSVLQDMAAPEEPRPLYDRDKLKLIHSERGWRLVAGSETLTLADEDLVEIHMHPDGRGRIQLNLYADEISVLKGGRRKPRRSPRGSRGRGGRK